MKSASNTQFTFNYKEVLVDEIALDGLEGIGVELLWKRVENRIGSTITEKMKNRYFNFIASCESISFYKLNEPLPNIEIMDRFSIIDKSTGHLLDPPDYLDGPYEFHPVDNEYGSCPSYDTRLLIPKSALQTKSYEEITSEFGENLVLVASLEERWHAVASHLPFTYLTQLTPTHYCLLELIGKGRQNGQMTIGKTNLSKIVKEPKLLFYNRNVLQKLGLVRTQYATQVTGGRAMKSILLRLKRFHRPTLESLPKLGPIHKIVQYLLSRPGRSEQNEIMIKRGYMTSLQSKRLQKGINIFHFEERQVTLDQNVDDEKKRLSIKKKFVVLTSHSDESSQSDEETNGTVKCKYKVGVNLMRQAYELFLEAGLKGLTQVEIAQHLGIEFYTSRTVCRILKNRKIVREFFEDKGRQRTARYIAVAATKEMDKEYAKEKDKLLEYANNASTDVDINDTINITEADDNDDNNDDNDENYEVPLKKIKKEKEELPEKTEIEDAITEIKVLDGFENITCSLLNAKKTPTLRQLKFANGILKVIHKLKYVIGFQTLSTLVSKEINEPAMDTKSLKLFIQKLIIGGQIKILKLQRPKNYIKHTFFICAPHIKTTDPIITNKYKEICARSQMPQKPKKSVISEVTRPCTQFIYPRYMKIQKLHEFLMKLIYFTNRRDSSSYPLGFGSLFYIIPEMTIEFALGNINNMDVSDVAQLKFNENLYSVKIRNAPDSLGRILLQSKSLQNSIRVGLKVLAVLGLVQLINSPSSIMSRDGGLVTYLFYVNRKAKILDTSGRWPRDNPDLAALEKTFHFQTKQDVTDYWQEVFNISLNTTIIMAKRERYRLIHPMRGEDTVEEYDTGERFGDGCGPCGFDSSIFMDISRLWRTFIYRNPNCPQSLIVKTKMKLLRSKKPKIPTAKVQEAAKAKKKRAKREKEKTIAVKKDIIPRRFRKKQVDALIKWNDFDDKLIMMCKIAITIMSPVSQPGCLKIRNTVARDLLSLRDTKKTASYCHKRALTLESNTLLVHKRNCILNYLRGRKDLIKAYEGLLKVLRMRYQTNISRYVNEARLPMLELIWIISQVEKSKTYIQRIPCIAMNLEDFNANYTITRSSANRAFNIYKESSNQPDFATLKEGILLTVMLSIKEHISSATAKKIYTTFKIYPEGRLRIAIEHLRKSGAIAAREKVMNNHFNKVNFDDIVHSSYKISAMYRRKWLQRLDTDFGDNLEQLLDSEIPKNGLKGSAELNCLLCEMCACDAVEIISDTIPIVTGFAGSILQEEQMNVIDMENKFKLKSGLIGWKNKTNIDKFSKLYEAFDYDYILQNLNKYAIVNNINEEEKVDTSDEIISYLNNKREVGASFQELMNNVVPDRKLLYDQLTKLQEEDIIKRVGMFDNVMVLKKFSTTYFLRVKQGLYLIPTPWMNLDGQVEKDVFFKWAAVILNKVFESPGCSIAYLSNHFECITTRSVQDICTFLEKCECVILKNMQKKEIDLFSYDEAVEELYDFNPFEKPDNILVFSVKNSVTKFVYIRKYMTSIIDISD